jgi:hypothetical protein
VGKVVGMLGVPPGKLGFSVGNDGSVVGKVGC